MSTKLEQRLEARQKEINELKLLSEATLHEKGVMKASTVAKDVDKLVAITESVNAVINNSSSRVLPTIGKQLMLEAAAHINSSDPRRVIEGVNLTCAYGAVVNKTSTIEGVSLVATTGAHKKLLEEAAKEFEDLSEMGKRIVSIQFQGLPTMIVSEALFGELLETGVELLQEAKAESQALSYIQKNLAPLKTTARRIPQLKELNKLLTAFDKRIQGMISGQIPQSKLKGFVAELAAFYSAIQEFTATDLPIILDSDLLEKAKQSPEKPLITLYPNGSDEHRELYNMMYGRLQPNDNVVVGFVKKLLGKPLNLQQVMKMNGGYLPQMATDFINLSFDQLTTLTEIGLTSGKDLMQSNFMRKFSGLSPDAEAQNARVAGQQAGQAGQPAQAAKSNQSAAVAPTLQAQLPPKEQQQLQQQLAKAGNSPERVTDVIKQSGQINVPSVEQMTQQVNGVVDRIIGLSGIPNDKENRKRIIAALFDLD